MSENLEDVLYNEHSELNGTDRCQYCDLSKSKWKVELDRRDWSGNYVICPTCRDETIKDYFKNLTVVPKKFRPGIRKAMYIVDPITGVKCELRFPWTGEE